LFTLLKPSEEDNTQKLVTVYAVRDDKNGYPHFLIYEDGEWKYVSAKHFIPCD
jgi:hypothetical protein